VQPAEGGKSSLDGTVGIPQVYNAVLAEARRVGESGGQSAEPTVARSRPMLRWATPRALPYVLRHYRYISVTGLPNVTRVFDDVERGKLKDIDFIECYACWAGCGNGNLTVDNVYVCQAKLQTLMAGLPASDPVTDAEVERRYPQVDFLLDRPSRRACGPTPATCGSASAASRRPRRAALAARLRLRPVRRAHLRHAGPRRGRRRGGADRLRPAFQQRLQELRRIHPRSA